MKFRAAMLATALVGLGASAAEAQFRWHDGPGYYEGLPARAIVRAVRARGLTPVSRVVRRGDVYFVRAADDYGRVSRVMIDAYSGHIMRIEANVRRERGPGLPPLTRPRPRYDDDRDYARPPRAVPGAPYDDRDYVAPAPRAVPEAPPRVLPADPDDARGSGPPRAERDFSPRGEAEGLPPPPMLGSSRSAAAPSEAPPQARSAPSRRENTRTAALNPNPPSPRPRPATPSVPQVSEPVKPESPAQAAVPPDPAPEPATTSAKTADPVPQNEQSDDPAKTKPLPRVILPGGPLPKAERTAETQPSARERATTAENPRGAEENAARREAGPPSESGEAAPPAMPPVQGLE